MASSSPKNGTGTEESGSYENVDESRKNSEKMCYEDGDKERKTDTKKGSKDKDKDKEKEKDKKEIEKVTEKEPEETEKKCDETKVKIVENVISGDDEDRIIPEESDVVVSDEKTVPVAESQEKEPSTCSIRTKTFGPNHTISQGQIDSYTARVLAMEKSLGSNETRVEQSVTATTTTVVDYPYQHITSDPVRARSPSVPNTLTLGIPRDPEGYQYGSMDDTSPSGSRRALSPLLEVRRPHCTLNCENCKTILEERFKHSKL